MSQSDASRIQSAQVSAIPFHAPVCIDRTAWCEAKGGKDMSSSGFAARAQSAGDRNANAAGGGGGGSGGGGGKSESGGEKSGSGGGGGGKKWMQLGDEG